MTLQEEKPFDENESMSVDQDVDNQQTDDANFDENPDDPPALNDDGADIEKNPNDPAINYDNIEEKENLDESTSKDNEGSKSKKAVPRPRVVSDRAVSLPLSRIKQIMKMDPEVHLASAESVFLITKCAEIFVNMLTKEAYSYTSSSKKKTVQKKDIDSAINNSEQLSFLDATFD